MTQQQIVLTGAKGQLGLTFQELWEDAPLRDEYELCCADIKEMDISSTDAIQEFLANRPAALIINGAAYTAVDRAEEEREQAFKVNQQGAVNLALWAREHQCRFIQISTDFVFSGSKGSPYKTHDETKPISVYGQSKVAGEQAILSSYPENSIIVRTSWLYSPFQSNFVKTMLKLMAEREELNVVNDQVGSPTSTYSLVRLLFKIVESDEKCGIFHWSDKGGISWYDFALEIQQQGMEAAILETAIPINSIPTVQYPTPASRPAYSVLDTLETQLKFSIEPEPWRESLRKVVQTIANH
ncbi:MAG: dTDP-4-dehydrorhamnose reductase [Gammaproteobacteria bacterium]|nr:dTDP-4-dehydrorhamnose reductase [Gammaproteobacteria bacterium]